MVAGSLNISVSGDISAVNRRQDELTTTVLKKEEVRTATVKAEMKEVKEENERLKNLLAQIEEDYTSLKMRYFDAFSHHQTTPQNINKPSNDNNVEEESQISLRLGLSPDHCQSKVVDNVNNITSSTKSIIEEDGDESSQSLKLGLDYGGSCQLPLSDSKSLEMKEAEGHQSPENSVSETKEEDAAAAGETWPPSKALKTTRSGDDDQSQANVKRARVSVRTRCDTPTMNDGCQWRKYGQKVAKGNPCPRAYYRCTVAPSCPVRKQVQRCADDMSILITTYEGTHNHPLPVAATAMASTTSAAASMLLSGSFTSQSSASNLHGLNFSLSDSSRTRPLYFPNSTSPPFPTITLDLTNPSHMFSSNAFRSTPRFPSTNLSFSSSESNIAPTVWSSGGYTNYSNSTAYNKNHILGASQVYAQAGASQQALTETLTKAITTDPSLRSVIAAAITSMVGKNSPVQHKRMTVNEEVMGAHQAII